MNIRRAVRWSFFGTPLTSSISNNVVAHYLFARPPIDQLHPRPGLDRLDSDPHLQPTHPRPPELDLQDKSSNRRSPTSARLPTTRACKVAPERLDALSLVTQPPLGETILRPSTNHTKHSFPYSSTTTRDSATNPHPGGPSLDTEELYPPQKAVALLLAREVSSALKARGPAYGSYAL